MHHYRTNCPPSPGAVINASSCPAPDSPRPAAATGPAATQEAALATAATAVKRNDCPAEYVACTDSRGGARCAPCAAQCYEFLDPTAPRDRRANPLAARPSLKSAHDAVTGVFCHVLGALGSRRPAGTGSHVTVSCVTATTTAPLHSALCCSLDQQSTQAAAQAVRMTAVAGLDRRIGDLLERLTFSEKISLLNNDAPGIPRLMIQPYTTSECLHGYATQSSANGTTGLPLPTHHRHHHHHTHLTHTHTRTYTHAHTSRPPADL